MPLIVGGVACVYVIWGFVTSTSPVLGGLLAVLVGLALFAAQTWAVHLSVSIVSRPVDTWRSAALALVATGLEMLVRVVVPSPVPGRAVAAIWTAEIFVLAVVAQYVLPATFGRALVIALLSRVIALLAYVAVAFVLLACLLVWFRQPTRWTFQW